MGALPRDAVNTCPEFATCLWRNEGDHLIHVLGSLLQDSDGEATRGNNGGNNGAVAG